MLACSVYDAYVMNEFNILTLLFIGTGIYEVMGRRLPVNIHSLTSEVVTLDPYLQSCVDCSWTEIIYQKQLYHFNLEKQLHYDGITSAVTYKIANIYNKAMNLYFKRQFTEAIQLFHKVCVIKDHCLRYIHSKNKESGEVLIQLSSHDSSNTNILEGIALNSIKLSASEKEKNNENRDSTKSMIDSLDVINMTSEIDISMAISDSNTDIPSKILINRCKYYIDHPPPLNWDGVEHLSTKEG